jgi:hypothetical protein
MSSAGYSRRFNSRSSRLEDKSYRQILAVMRVTGRKYFFSPMYVLNQSRSANEATEIVRKCDVRHRTPPKSYRILSTEVVDFFEWRADPGNPDRHEGLEMGEWNHRHSGVSGGRRRSAILTTLRWFFGGTASDELISTHLCLPVDPATVWGRIVLFEEVTGRPPLLVRLFMPHPVRTDGEKTRVGALVRCKYESGDLVKRIIAVEPPYRMVFDVIEQSLGIEGCVVAQRGSYEIDRNGKGSDVILTTQYRAFLHPRRLWRPLEEMVAHRLHLHILRGMQEGGPRRAPVVHLSAMSHAAEASTQATEHNTSTERGTPPVAV